MALISLQEEDASELPDVLKPWTDLLGPEKYAAAMKKQEEYEAETGLFLKHEFSKIDLRKKGCSYTTKVDDNQFNTMVKALERLRENSTPEEFNEQANGVWESTMSELELDVEYVGTEEPRYSNTREWKYSNSSLNMNPEQAELGFERTLNDELKKAFDLIVIACPPCRPLASPKPWPWSLRA